jgi:hypothetical protein
MVLDLVVQPAERHVDDASAPHVAAHEHLPAQEVDLDVGRHDWHALVVGSECGPHVQPEQRELDTDERERLAR